MEYLSFEQINGIDLVDFLATIGLQPKKRKAHHYYYLSPLAGHPVHRPTFIVNRRLNHWRETTTRQSGGLADLAVSLYDCTIGELTTILRAALPPVSQLRAVKGSDNPPSVTVEQTHPIRSGYLERYLWERRVPLHVARLYCREAWYKRGNGVYQALAFPSGEGGFELFNRNCHYRVPPCGPTLIRNNSQSVAVFRQVFDLLTYVSLHPGPLHQLPDLLVLNAPVPFPAVREMIAPYDNKHLFLPNDATGIAFSTLTIRALGNCHDHRSIYLGYTDLNDWICRIGTAPGPKISLSTAGIPHQPIFSQPAVKKPRNAPTPERSQDV